MLIKICGITTPETAIACCEAGADMIGLVHFPPSPRHLDASQIGEILDAVKPMKRHTVLVVVEQLPTEHVVSRFDYIQPYGKVQFDIPMKRIHVIKDEAAFAGRMNDHTAESGQDLYALEMSSGVLPGGNGAAWDWSSARPFCERYRTLIAGGVTPENVAEVIRDANPFGIDVSSGVEASPGVKDIEKVRRLIANAQKVGNARGETPSTAMQSFIFVGYRGTGKTTVARKLAERLGIPAIDADAEIQRQSGKSIAEIFAQDGEAAFRDTEESVIAEILQSTSPLVLATGGGAILRENTRKRLRQSGRVFWLTALPDTILQRITSDVATETMRPNLTSLPMREEIIAILGQRQPLYGEVAHERVDTDCRTADEIVEIVIRSKRA
ncbi:MAG: AAA family ATPase [Planctomycetaceae bacterium]|nr:AAA family ATPase [Planctomycetaceae bacterium]